MLIPVFKECVRTHARTLPPPPQNLGAGPPRPALFGAGGFRLSCIFPPPTSPRPGGLRPTLGTGRRRGAGPRARSDCFVRSCASAARMGVDFSPSTLAASSHPGFRFRIRRLLLLRFRSGRRRPKASASASAVKVARTRSARLPLASNGGWLSQVQLLPPRRSLVVAVVGNAVMRDIEYRSTVRLRQAACTPGAVRFVGLVVRVSHDEMLSPMYWVSPPQDCVRA